MTDNSGSCCKTALSFCSNNSEAQILSIWNDIIKVLRMFAVMEILSNWFVIMKIDKHTARFLYVHWQFHTDESNEIFLWEVVSVYWTMTIDLALHWLPCGLSMLLQKLRSGMRLQRHKGGLCSYRPLFLCVYCDRMMKVLWCMEHLYFHSCTRFLSQIRCLYVLVLIFRQNRRKAQNLR